MIFMPKPLPPSHSSCFNTCFERPCLCNSFMHFQSSSFLLPFKDGLGGWGGLLLIKIFQTVKTSEMQAGEYPRFYKERVRVPTQLPRRKPTRWASQ